MNRKLLRAALACSISLAILTPPAGLAPTLSVDLDAAAAQALVARSHRVYVDGDQVHAIGPDFKARFDRAGITFTPALRDRIATSAPVQLELESIRRGEHLIVAADGSTRPTLEGDSVVYQRGDGIRECYEVRSDDLHQTFHFAHRPPGDGDLVVRMRMATRLPVHASDDGGLACELAGIGGVTIGGVTGLGADGRSAPGTLRTAGEHVELVLPAAFVDTAMVPLVLDPVIGAKIDFTTGQSGAPAVAFTSGYYLVVWEQRYSATDVDIVGQRVSATGTLGPLTMIYDAASWAIKPKVACLKGGLPRFLVVWEEDTTLTFTRIRGCSVNLAMTVSTPVTIAGGSLEYLHAPDVGGDRTGSTSYAMVVWENENLGIQARRVFVPNLPGNPAVFSAFPEFTVEANAGGAQPTTNSEPAISKSAGDVGRYLVVWRRSGSGNASIRARLMDTAGTLIDASSTQVSQSLLASIDHHNPDCDGDGDNFIVAWQRQESSGSPDHDIYVRPVFHLLGYLGSETVQPVATVANHDEVDPAVAYAGYQTLVAFGDETILNLHDIVVTSVDPFHGKIGHSPVTLNTGAGSFGSIDIASLWAGDPGIYPPHQAMIAWQLAALVRGRIFESPSDAASLGGASGSGGDTHAPCAFSPNANFTLHLRNGAPSALALLAIAPAAAPIAWGTGMVWPTVGPVILATTTDGAGKTEMQVSVPAGFVGVPLVAQWLVLDGLGYLGLSTSDAISFTLQAP